MTRVIDSVGNISELNPATIQNYLLERVGLAKKQSRRVTGEVVRSLASVEQISTEDLRTLILKTAATTPLTLGSLLDARMTLRQALGLQQLMAGTLGRSRILAFQDAVTGTLLKEAAVWILEWALGKGLDALFGLALQQAGDGKLPGGWRQDGPDELVNDGAGANYFSDSIAPRISSYSFENPGCCEQNLSKGIKLELKIKVTDAGGDWFENDTGVTNITVTAVRPGTGPVQEGQQPAPESTQVGQKELNDKESDATDDDIAEFTIVLCIPCGYIVNGKANLVIKVADENRNARMKRVTQDIPEELRKKCCP